MFASAEPVNSAVFATTTRAEDTPAAIPAIRTPPVAELVDVSKTFSTDGGEVRAIERISLPIRTGEILAIVGPSGCGKSTLLQLLAGFQAPTNGDVLVNGERLSGLNRLCTMMPQGDSLFPWHSVRRNVAYGSDGRADRVEAYLDAVGLRDFADRWPRQLSAGMRKRAEVARAYASHAQLLLLDEPFAALDVMTKESMHTLLQRVWVSDRRTIVFVTHDVEEALFVGHRVAVLSNRPARVTTVIDVPFEYPRSPDLKLCHDFIAARAGILGTLRGDE